MTEVLNAQLFAACDTGNRDAAIKFLEQGANLDLRNSNGQTPALAAMLKRFAELALDLIDRAVTPVTPVNAFGVVPDPSTP